MTKIERVFSEAFAEFIRKERANIINNVNERNLCSRLGLYLDQSRRRHRLRGYYVDAEYNRKQNGRIKTIMDEEMKVVVVNCDLILHSRGEIVQRDNLIAIEMKKSDQPTQEKDKDRQRLRALTKASYDDVWSYDGKTLPEHVCGYERGYLIILDVLGERFEIEGYEKGRRVESWDGAI